MSVVATPTSAPVRASRAASRVKGRAIGVDFGTSNVRCAGVRHGAVHPIWFGDEDALPTAFAIDRSGHRLVGREAIVWGETASSSVVEGFKRLIGHEYGSPTVSKVQDLYGYRVLQGDQDDVLVRVRGQVFTLEQVAATCLRRVKEAAESARSEEVDQVVITVPAAWNQRQRRAMRSAGKLAGLEVLRIVDDSTAASLAYALERKNERVAVLSFGGGAFSASIVDIRGKVLEVVATGGDSLLGGIDLDERLTNHIAKALVAAGDTDRSGLFRLRHACERAKIELSAAPVAVVSLGDQFRISRIEVTRSMLESMSEDLIDRALATFQRILGEAGRTAQEIDRILLFGGPSAMPLFRNQLAFLGRPVSPLGPDAAAVGAALLADDLSRAASTWSLLDVLPSAIGIAKPDGSMHVLFAKQQPVPDYKTRVLATSKDDQRSIMLRVYQGENKAVEDNTLLGIFVCRGLRHGPRGAVKLEVTFHIDTEGLLTMTARDQETGGSVDVRAGFARSESNREPSSEPKASVERSIGASSPIESVAPVRVVSSAHPLAGPGEDACAALVSVEVEPGRHATVFEAGIRLPATAVLRCSTGYDDQESFEVRLYRHPPRQPADLLACILLSGLPSGPRGAAFELVLELRPSLEGGYSSLTATVPDPFVSLTTWYDDAPD